MPNPVARLLLYTLIALPACTLAAQRYEGLAYAHDGGLVYREVHWLHREVGVPSRLVLYRCPDGRAFARKRMRDVPNATAPSFDFTDARLGYREGVRANGAGREAYWQERTGAAVVTHALGPAADVVIDAGFDAFVRANWSSIDRRGRVLSFLVPSRIGALRFRVRDAGTATVLGRPARVLRMGLAGLLGVALPEVELAYDAGDRRLLRFRGLGTVRDADGRLQVLRVDFPTPAVPAAPAEVEAALREPLVTSCAR